MNIVKTIDNTSLSLSIEGRIDTLSAPALEAELKNSLEGITHLTLDFEKVEYISSAGLRVLLLAQKAMNRQGTMVVKNVNDVVWDVFEVTGFSEILTIE